MPNFQEFDTTILCEFSNPKDLHEQLVDMRKSMSAKSRNPADLRIIQQPSE